ncbi:hypothetical protein N7457_008843 [Penicillium paradoxum]|uniref:uncharacterized protein n=1 Tax=Penicillium paradoxum TaxID=176176 RepID=UPI0025484B8E|nr:uncharacterized protein N7457_008843 [Penicillium paradoxum]KAJ5773947.1 hypothetical protein N7457_008843 [Penicillium paradoxum]
MNFSYVDSGTLDNAVLLVELLYQVIALSPPPLPRIQGSHESPTELSKINMPPLIDLLPYRDQIIGLSQKGASPSSICETLTLDVNPRTIQRRLEWGQKKPRVTPPTIDDTLHKRIKELVLQVGLSDKQILPILHKEGFAISDRTLRKRRKQLGICRRTDDLEAQSEQFQQIKELIADEINMGDIEGYGRTYLHQHLRRRGYLFPV